MQKCTNIKIIYEPQHILTIVIVCIAGGFVNVTAQRHEIYCHDLEVIGSNPGRVKPVYF